MIVLNFAFFLDGIKVADFCAKELGLAVKIIVNDINWFHNKKLVEVNILWRLQNYVRCV